MPSFIGNFKDVAMSLVKEFKMKADESADVFQKKQIEFAQMKTLLMTISKKSMKKTESALLNDSMLAESQNSNSLSYN